MQNVLYANANISMQISRYLLTREKIRALSAADSIEDVKTILSGMGYDTNLPTDDEIIERERAKTKKNAIELSTDDAVIRCIEILDSRHAVRAKLAAENPQMTSFELDILCETQLFTELLPYTKKIKSETIANYFAALADTTNLKTFAKHKLAGVPPTDTFVAGGIIPVNDLSSAFEADDGMTKLLSVTPYDIAAVGYTKAIAERNLIILEDAISHQLDEIVSADKDDVFKPNLVFWWFIKKQTEFIVVKTIMVNKRLKMTPVQLREQLRGIYERFN